mmetsp:Transcript_25872/g.54002  ORF Transcript_25872/g.54002 Transcript_25872/m.54002 type:complete len:205 (-) Transcript_25872:462-1076(-)
MQMVHRLRHEANNMHNDVRAAEGWIVPKSRREGGRNNYRLDRQSRSKGTRCKSNHDVSRVGGTLGTNGERWPGSRWGMSPFENLFRCAFGVAATAPGRGTNIARMRSTILHRGAATGRCLPLLLSTMDTPPPLTLTSIDIDALKHLRYLPNKWQCTIRILAHKAASITVTQIHQLCKTNVIHHNHRRMWLFLPLLFIFNLVRFV